MEYNFIVCGGTFDHLHKGHKEFLRFTFSKGKKVLIGLTSDSYISKIKKETTESFDIRKKNLLNFLRDESFMNRSEVFLIDDLFGPTLSKDLLINAIVVSQNLIPAAKLINKKREEMGLSKLKVFISPLVLAGDGKIISSSRIREGIIDKNGLPLKTLSLPNHLRSRLKKPFGVLLANEINFENINSDKLITVGDITTELFNKNNLQAKISVVDFKVQRKEKFISFKELGFLGNEKVIKVNNPPGSITPSLFKTIELLFSKAIAGRVIIKIEGEEDMAVLPLIIFAPLGTVIFYGQKNEGLVRVDVDQNSKRKSYELLCQFL